MNKIAPQDMRQHLMLNQSRLSATEEFSRDDKNQAGFIAPVIKDPVKGGKPNGVPYNFGKGSGTKGKGKMHKGLRFQPQHGECMQSNPSQDPLLRDIREWSNMSEKGQGHRQPQAKAKVKARARENIQEKGTTTRSRLDLRMKMDSARWVILV